MAVFESLSDRMNHIFSKLRNKGKLTELEIKQAMREIRVALLEADVNFAVVRILSIRSAKRRSVRIYSNLLLPPSRLSKSSMRNWSLLWAANTRNSKSATSPRQSI